MVVLSGRDFRNWKNYDLLQTPDTARINKDGVSESGCNLPNYPIKVTGSKGVRTKDGIVICGGHNADDHPKSCYQLENDEFTWTPFPPLTIGNSWYFGMVYLQDSIFAISKDKSAVYRHGQWEDIEPRPVKYGYSCAAILDENRIISMGGKSFHPGEVSVVFVNR